MANKRNAWLLIVAGALALAACGGPSGNNFPVPLVLSDGSRGYSMRGYVSYTSSRETAVDEVTGRMTTACGGPVEMKLLDLSRADSIGGVPHFLYEAVARCLPQTGKAS